MAMVGIYLVAVGLLAVAGIAKSLRPGDTARALAELSRQGRRRGVSMVILTPGVRLLAGLEAVLGLAALVFPTRILAALVAASYLAFAGFVLFARARGGVLATCGCFGSPDTPPTVPHAVVDLGLCAGGVGVAVAGASGTIATVLDHQPFDGVPLVAASVLTAGLAFAVLSPLARLNALRHFDPTGVSR
jgi:Methylamine utilisation protein MauE